MNKKDIKNLRKLRKEKYNPWVEGTLLFILGCLLCGAFIYSIATHTLSICNAFTIVALVVSVLMLLTGLWVLIKKPTKYVYIGGWKYRLYKKVNKYQFILITGMIDAAQIAIILFLLYFFKKLPMETFQWKELLAAVLCFLFMTLAIGYRNYQTYKSGFGW